MNLYLLMRFDVTEVKVTEANNRFSVTLLLQFLIAPSIFYWSLPYLAFRYLYLLMRFEVTGVKKLRQDIIKKVFSNNRDFRSSSDRASLAASQDMG
ncbi:hypothetical protein DPMN_133078 [Dreissena polymorpha]|uniref:Uncharacterized protein n=1 Tax=Dreissena polymorpha TaxID=45954 RepID=A0A9D4FTL1_DREPO|nr:hypothetical protein DPMN_133078 [Dreissena polymorpha]